MKQKKEEFSIGKLKDLQVRLHFLLQLMGGAYLYGGYFAFIPAVIALLVTPVFSDMYWFRIFNLLLAEAMICVLLLVVSLLSRTVSNTRKYLKSKHKDKMLSKTIDSFLKGSKYNFLLDKYLNSESYKYFQNRHDFRLFIVEVATIGFVITDVYFRMTGQEEFQIYLHLIPTFYFIYSAGVVVKGIGYLFTVDSKDLDFIGNGKSDIKFTDTDYRNLINTVVNIVLPATVLIIALIYKVWW